MFNMTLSRTHIHSRWEYQGLQCLHTCAARPGTASDRLLEIKREHWQGDPQCIVHSCMHHVYICMHHRQHFEHCYFQKNTTVTHLTLQRPELVRGCALLANKQQMIDSTKLYPWAICFMIDCRYTHLAWALWERRMGNMQQCLLLLQRGCSLNPTDPALYQAWALMERERGHFDRARALFEAGLKADPSNISLYQAWGIMEAALVS